MKVNWKLVAIGMTALMVDSSIAAYRNREKLIEANKRFEAAARLSNHYATLLNRNGIHPDDFDSIVMNELTKTAEGED